MNPKNRVILDSLLDSVANNTISKEDKEKYDKALEKEWNSIHEDTKLLLRYYPFAICGL